ncbi:MAG: lipoyl(octanoyl) transferase LipB [Acidobacteria bacterium]|nr:lipoyl(octanoyl) transferase LipB [Acidobacteriota bacterium]MBI3424023.1 lipoyl(octanoyl) transferase LipB [Acidobacteriota bacterium]
MRSCEARYLGRVSYTEALALQQTLHEARKRDEAPDTLLLVEHPPVITLGRGANKANVLADEATRQRFGVELFETGRGGDVTYHGPGQLVGYPIMNLAPDRQDVRRYVQDLQEVLVRTARDFGVAAEPRGGAFVGVWVGKEKLAAIGIRISRWVTLHGFAFNVTTDLSYFQLIVPCGIKSHGADGGHGVTSLQQLTGKQFALQEVAASVTTHFGEVFNRSMFVAGISRN